MKRLFRIWSFEPDPERDLADEIEAHLGLKVEELMSKGASEDEAWQEARRSFGDPERARKESKPHAASRERKHRAGEFLDSLSQDLRYALRTLRRSPGMTLLTIVILALGIGANTAIFSVLKAVFLQPLPFPEPEELTFVWNRNARTGGYGPTTFPDFLDWREQNQSFEAMGAFGGAYLNLTDGEDPVQIRGARVTAGVFDVLEIPPAMGRALLPEEDLTEEQVIVLSHHLWTERYGADPDILEKTVQVDGSAYDVVGVMPEVFYHPTPWGLTDPYLAWIPMPTDQWIHSRNSYSYQVLARLRDGISRARAQEDMNRIGATLEAQYPDTNENERAWVVPLHVLLYGDAAAIVLLVLLATGAVLLVACGNIAGFLMARAATRRTEMAIRASLGAGRARIVRQLLTESIVLAVAGGIAGLLLAAWSMGGLKTLIPPTFPRTEDIRLDAGILLFTFILSLATGVIFGLVPALAASRTRLTESLKEGGRAGRSGKKRLRTQNAFVVAQIALSLCLAHVGLLLVRSYGTLQELDQGFDPEHTLTMGVSLGGDRYDELEEREAFLRVLFARLEAIPGVTAAGVTSKLPLRGGTNGPTVTEEQFAQDPTTEGVLTEVSSVSGDYFASMGIPLLAGRTLTPDDADTIQPGVVINEAAAQRFWPDQDPLGRRFGFEGDNASWLTVVGVVGNVRQTRPGATPRPEVYWDYRVNPRVQMYLTLDAQGDPRELIRPARAAVLSVDPLLPVSNIRTMGEMLATDLSGREFYTLLVGLFSALAVLLAAAGIYGVISYFVAQRTQELGIRLALGAARKGLVLLVLRRALVIVFWGLVVGLAAAWIASRIISGLLFGVGALDPTTLMTGVGLLVFVGLTAALVPGLRGTRLSPVAALRAE